MSSTSDSSSPSTASSNCCSICLQPFTYPAELPCKHVFCYLCIKGASLNSQLASKRCALCRAEIPDEYFESPKLVKNDVEEEDKDNEDEAYCWYYKSNRNDLWWKYDRNSINEIENAYRLYLIDETKAQFKHLIAGNVYIIDFKNNMQIRNDNRALRRRIKRDRVKLENTIGVAGLKTTTTTTQEEDALVQSLDKLSINKKSP